MNTGTILLINDLTSFFAQKLSALSSLSGSWTMFEMERNVYYLATIFAEYSKATFSGQRLSFSFVDANVVVPNSIESIGPVLARSIADQYIFCCGIYQKMPPVFLHSNPTPYISAMYKIAGDSYPDQSIRPALISMAENTAPWIEVLPDLRKKISLVISI